LVVVLAQYHWCVLTPLKRQVHEYKEKRVSGSTKRLRPFFYLETQGLPKPQPFLF